VRSSRTCCGGWDRAARSFARQDHELDLDDPKWTDEQLIDLMLQHPILIQRPIVVTGKGARLCRPAEAVLDILP
jgi:arsenate reductase-like glutaredoxin family protein